MIHFADLEQELYEEMMLDNGIQYDNDVVAEELLQNLFEAWKS